MRKSRILISFLLILILVFSNITLSSAIVYEGNDGCVLSDELINQIKDLNANDTVSVYLWYDDIEQDEISKQAVRISKVDPDSIEETSKDYKDLKSTLFQDENETEETIKKYIELSQKQRREKAKQVSDYLSQRKRLSVCGYSEASNRIKKSINLDEKDIIYCSQLAPMIIATLSVEKIRELEYDPNLVSIDYYEEIQLVETSQDSASTALRADRIAYDTDLNLSGIDVKVGIIENHRPLFSGENSNGIVLDNTTPEYRYSNGVALTDYGNLVVVGDTPPSTNAPNLTHVDNTASDILFSAPNAKIYASKYRTNYIEAMILDGVRLFNMSAGYYKDESYDYYAYSSEDRWVDHLAAYYGVTFLNSAGNSGNTDYPRVISPGMAYNIITVGSCLEDNISLNPSSSYKNCTNQVFGCEKPDIVSSRVVNGGGTSRACSFFCGVMAMMFELDPTLQLEPYVTKAIVLASCHDKAIQSQTLGGQEDYDTGIVGRQESGTQSGITERQGAGIPDAWRMASIICQGTYGSDVLSDDCTYINIEQPPYDGVSMSVSLAFLKENYPLATPSNYGNIIEGLTNNLDLTVYNNDTAIKKSALYYSSTEMCNFPLSTSDYKYRFKIERADSYTNPVKYGYAWSIDEPRCTLPRNSGTCITEGIYHLKNRSNDKYLDCTINQQTGERTAGLSVLSNDNQSSFSDASLCWIVENSTSGMTLKTGNGNSAYYLGVTNSSLMQITFANLRIEKDTLGYYCIFNADKSCVLSVNNGIPYWKAYTANQAIETCDTWTFERSNYLKCDVDCDGALSQADATMIQYYLNYTFNLNNIQYYLADVTRDGEVDIMDATICLRILSLYDFYHLI